MGTTFVEELLSAVDAGGTPPPAAMEEWARQLPDAAAAARQLTQLRQRVIALRPGAQEQVDAVLCVVLESALEHVTQLAIDAALDDPVTGLPTRRLFERDARRALSAATRTRRPVSVVMIDVDGLKTVNDTRGHAAGDAHLRAVADALRAIVREGDGAYRIGGDEFALLLADADQRAADQVMSRFSGPPVSWGAASAADGDGDSLLASADAQMYRTRQARRVAASQPQRPRSRALAPALLAAALATLSTGALMAVTTGSTGPDRNGAPLVSGPSAPADPPKDERRSPLEVATGVDLPAPDASGTAVPPQEVAPAQREVPIVAVPVNVPDPPVPLPATPPALPPVPAPALPPEPGLVPTVVEESVTFVADTVCRLLC